MRPIIYIDILFALNLFINFLLLWATGRMLRTSINYWRIASGAMVGALYAVLMFFPSFSMFYSIFFKLLISVAIIAVSFKIKNLISFLKLLGIFYFVTITLGGGCFALFYFTNIGATLGAIVSNGIIYFNLPWEVLLLTIIISSILIRIFWNSITRKWHQSKLLYKIRIFYNEKSVTLDAFLDTGNDLFDPLTQSPVIIAEYTAIREALPPALRVPYETGDALTIDKMQLVLENTYGMRVRLIPFSSIGKENGLLLAFKPDYVEVISNEGDYTVGECMIAIYQHTLSQNGNYVALFHPQL